MTRNSEVDWSTFDPNAYWTQNYASAVRRDDYALIRDVCEHVKATLMHRATAARGIDVGCGSNLYPAMVMAPFCDEIVLADTSQANIDWVTREIRDLRNNDYHATLRWGPYWDACRGSKAPWSLLSLRKVLSRVRMDPSVIDALVPYAPRSIYDVGTMFFTAESMTEERGEFEAVIAGFLRSLRPGSPYAIACMELSTGYDVAGTWYPAIPVTVGDLFETISACKDVIGSELVHVRRIGIPEDGPLREGHQGMLLATGCTATPAGGGSFWPWTTRP